MVLVPGTTYPVFNQSTPEDTMGPRLFGPPLMSAVLETHKSARQRKKLARVAERMNNTVCVVSYTYNLVKSCSVQAELFSKFIGFKL